MPKSQQIHSELLNQLLEQSKEYTFIVDIESGNIIYYNKACCEISGTPLDELYSYKVWEFLPIYNDFKDWKTNIDFDHKNGCFLSENTITTASGDEIPVEIISRVIKKENNYYQLLTLKEITYKRKYEQQSKTTEEFYKLLIENSIESFFVVDSNGKFFYANQSTLQSLGYKESEFFNLTYRDIAAPGSHDNFNSNFKQLLEDHTKVVKTKGKLIAKDGSLRIFDFVAINLLNHPKAKGILVIGHDITNIVEYENKLIRNNKTYQNIINSVPYPIWISDWDGQLLLVNEACANNFHLNVNDCIGKNFVDLGSQDEDAKLFIEEDRRILIKFEPTPPIKTKYFNSGTKEMETGIIKRVPLIFFETPAVLGMAIDITEQESTKNLLIEKNAELEKVNQDLDRFIYAASHELRSPVTSLQGIINLAKEETDIKSLQEYMSLIAENVKRQDKIIRDLICFTKNEEQAVLAEPIDFSGVVTSVLDNLTNYKNYDKVKIYTNIHQDFPFHSDLLRIEIILKNLISNSLKYCKTKIPNPYIGINITTEEKSAIIEITDNGIGIKPERQDKIFNMFYRATDKETGTGLGLYLSKEAARKIKGEINYSSALDLGSKFTVILPNLEKIQSSELTKQD